MHISKVFRDMVLAVVVVCTGAPAEAQWVDHPTPGIPRSGDGKPNLSAPAPRTADGKPDLSGLWTINGLGYATNITDTPMVPAAQKLLAERRDAYGKDDPAVGCLPEGPRAAIHGLEPMRMVQTPHVVYMLYETSPARQIFTDGRPLPKDPNPSWMGYSVGRWDGDTFVIDTIGYNDKTWLDFYGHPHSEALHMTERFRRTDFGHMQLSMTFDDPTIYARPFTIEMTVSFMPDTDLLENVCLENEKDRARLVGRVSVDSKSATKVPRTVLAHYPGRYEGPFGNWTLSVDGDDLKIELGDGGGKHDAIPQSDTQFLFPALGGSIKFVTEKGEVTHFIMTIVEGDFRWDRKK